MTRRVVWFSAGAASAIATKLTLAEHGHERDIGHAVNKDADGPVWLDEMDPDRGDVHTEPSIDCSLMCAIAESDL